MGLRINQNIAALNAARNLRKTDGSLSRSLERLSSGFRVNRAADDPAGLIISENLRAQISGLSQAIRNSQNAVNLIKTAEAALDEVNNQLRSIRTLALDALNTGASDAVARAADQSQIASSIATLTRIGNQTQFGKKQLLDGSAGVTGSTTGTNFSFVSATSDTQSGTFNLNVTTAATQGTQTFTVNNESEILKDGTGVAAAIDLDAGEILTFKVDFGAGVALAADKAAVGTDLESAGLKDGTNGGVTVTFDKTNAIAFVTVDQAGGGTALTADAIDATILGQLNGSTIGQIINFNEDTGNANKLIATGRFAGLGFSVTDVSGVAGAKAGLTANTAAATGSAANSGRLEFTSNANEFAEFIIDFAPGAAAAEDSALRAALVAGGLQNNTQTIAALGNSTVQVTLDATEAKVTLRITDVGNSLANTSNDANSIDAALLTALNATGAGTSNIGRFVVFGSTTGAGAGSNVLTVSTALGGVGFTDTNAGGSAVQSGFATTTNTDTTAAVAALAAAEVDDLGDGLTAGDNTTAQGSNAVLLLAETLTFNNSTQIQILSRDTVANLANSLNQQLDNASIKVDASIVLDTTDDAATKGSVLTLKNDNFGNQNADGGKNTLASDKASANTLNFRFNVTLGGDTIEGVNVAGTINGTAATGVGQTLTLSSSGDAANGVSIKFTGTTVPATGTVTVAQQGLKFQVGANTGQTVTQGLPDVRANRLGLTATGLKTAAKSVADIDVTTADGATDALALVDAAIDQITSERGKLGAFQVNVLESSIASLGVARENLSAAESSIRDTDFADETVQFTRNQILLQAGTAILTQANAIPQAVLQLLA